MTFASVSLSGLTVLLGAKAKANNMPNDNIERGIKKASGELNSVNYEENIYEGYVTTSKVLYYIIILYYLILFCKEFKAHCDKMPTIKQKRSRK